MDNTNGNPSVPQNGARISPTISQNRDNTNGNRNVPPNEACVFPTVARYTAALLESGSSSQQPFGYGSRNEGHPNYADLQTSNLNAYGEVQSNCLNSNYLNGISGVTTGNFNSTNPNLNGVGQVQTADVNSRFLPNPAAENDSMQTSPAVEDDFDSWWITDAQLLFNSLTPQPEVPGTVIPSSSGKETASGMGGSAAQQIEETSSKKGESASVMKGSASNQMGEASNKSRSAIEVPITIREGAAIADSQEGPGTSAVQPHGDNEIVNMVYDPMYELMGLPVDPHLRMYLEQQKKGKNKDW